MTGPLRSVQLFSVGQEVTGSPELIQPASFEELGARELQDIERWLKQDPGLMGEDLKVIASQLTGFDKTKDRPDLLALDRQGRLVVVEIKRDDSGSSQDLQALRYAAYCSTFTSEQAVEVYRRYEAAESGRELSPAQAREELDEFLIDGDLTDIDSDPMPRIVLVAGNFQVGVTNTVLWLIQNSDLDISCVQLTPYRVKDEIVVSANVLIPLPQAADFQVRLQEKRRKAAARQAGDSIDFETVRTYIDSIPEGQWSSYGDVAAAAGAPKGAQALGTWLARNETDVPPKVYRVLNRHGEVSEGWQAAEPSLPPTPQAVREKLSQEGVAFDGQGRASQEQRWTLKDWMKARKGAAQEPGD